MVKRVWQIRGDVINCQESHLLPPLGPISLRLLELIASAANLIGTKCLWEMSESLHRRSGVCVCFYQRLTEVVLLQRGLEMVNRVW